MNPDGLTQSARSALIAASTTIDRPYLVSLDFLRFGQICTDPDEGWWVPLQHLSRLTEPALRWRFKVMNEIAGAENGDFVAWWRSPLKGRGTADPVLLRVRSGGDVPKQFAIDDARYWRSGVARLIVAPSAEIAEEIAFIVSLSKGHKLRRIEPGMPLPGNPNADPEPQN